MILAMATNYFDGFWVETYTHKRVHANVNQQAWPIFPGCLEARLSSTLPAITALQISSRYFWSVLKSLRTSHFFDFGHCSIIAASVQQQQYKTPFWIYHTYLGQKSYFFHISTMLAILAALLLQCCCSAAAVLLQCCSSNKGYKKSEYTIYIISTFIFKKEFNYNINPQNSIFF